MNSSGLCRKPLKDTDVMRPCEKDTIILQHHDWAVIKWLNEGPVALSLTLNSSCIKEAVSSMKKPTHPQTALTDKFNYNLPLKKRNTAFIMNYSKITKNERGR